MEFICENCRTRFTAYPTEKAARFCCWACYRAHPRESRAPDSTNYWTLHQRVRKARGAAKLYPCKHCGTQAHDWALPHGLTGKNPDDFMPLCRKCHLAYDGPHETSGHPGEANPAAKLTWEQVRTIRTLYGQVPVKDLAATYGIARTMIWRIVAGKNWAEHS